MIIICDSITQYFYLIHKCDPSEGFPFIVNLIDIVRLDRQLAQCYQEAMRHCRFGLTVVLLACIPLHAEETIVHATSYREVAVGDQDRVFSHVVDGGTWKTTFVLTNLTTSAAHFFMAFYSNDGTPLELPIEGIGTTSALSGSIAPKGTLIFETPGTAEELKQGSAFFYCLDRPAGQTGAQVIGTTVGAAAIFRQRVPGRQDVEAVVPVSSLADSKLTFPFDNSAGFLTGIAIVNGSTSAIPVTATIRNEDGSLLMQEVFPLGGRSKVVFVVPERYPATAGRRGSIELTTTSPGLGGLGLRFSPNGSFTSMHPVTLSTPVIPPPPDLPPCVPAVESRIDNTFEGWTGNTLFQLANGQVWQQAEFGYYYHYAYRPEVVIYYSALGCKMLVAGTDRTLLVKRVR